MAMNDGFIRVGGIYYFDPVVNRLAYLYIFLGDSVIKTAPCGRQKPPFLSGSIDVGFRFMKKAT